MIRNDTKARRACNPWRQPSVGRNMRPVLLFLLGSISVFAQPFSAGIKGGVPFTDFLNAAGNGVFNYTAPTQRYIIGGVAEVRLPLGLGVEFDALYRRLGYSGSGNLVDVFTASATTANNWEFPLLLKYRFHFPVGRPPSCPLSLPCQTRSTTANFLRGSPAPPPPDSPQYSERSWPTLPAPAPNDRTIRLAKTASLCAP